VLDYTAAGTDLYGDPLFEMITDYNRFEFRAFTSRTTIHPSILGSGVRLVEGQNLG
jgi:hypothetical protein